MKFTIAVIVAAATAVFAAPSPNPGACFDAGDCLLSGGGSCVNFACVTTTSSAAAGSATGAFCFDAGDCIINGGGQCVSNHCT